MVFTDLYCSFPLWLYLRRGVDMSMNIIRAPVSPLLEPVYHNGARSLGEYRTDYPPTVVFTLQKLH